MSLGIRNIYRLLLSCRTNSMLFNRSRTNVKTYLSRAARYGSTTKRCLRVLERTSVRVIGGAGTMCGLHRLACQGFTMEDIVEDIHNKGFAMEDIVDDAQNKTEVKVLEMNEAAALTHMSLLRQAGGITVDASMQLLHRALRAILDFSTQYRERLNECMDLLEYCTQTLRRPETHDQFWDMLVAARSDMESLKQQLKDLEMLLNYAYLTVENAAMAAFITDGEFSAMTAQQAMDSVKQELEKNTEKNQASETQYNLTHAQYIAATQKLIEEKEKETKDEDSSDSQSEQDRQTERNPRSEQDAQSDPESELEISYGNDT